ncbi:hypothetical protein WN51_00406 [Melipona quadrifasciata]|uniref:Uncharacterized protein n=1 Tax=Melipona quadrifasciata TaxID=166423 RepID=A0A0M9A263_9HYME|nr:hypothetical protein WN51_00406 [Melipona quadrifasciata]
MKRFILSDKHNEAYTSKRAAKVNVRPHKEKAKRKRDNCRVMNSTAKHSGTDNFYSNVGLTFNRKGGRTRRDVERKVSRLRAGSVCRLPKGEKYALQALEKCGKVFVLLCNQFLSRINRIDFRGAFKGEIDE